MTSKQKDDDSVELTPGPFRVKCLKCGTIAESWHRDLPAPEGAIIGMAFCECGNIGADSMGFIGYGRVLTRDHDNYEAEKKASEGSE